MDAHLGMLAVDIHTEGRHIGIVGTIEDVEESLMEGQSGTKHGTEYDIVFRQRNLQGAKRCRHGLGLIVEPLRHFVGHQLTDALYIMTECETVFLVTLITEF